MRTVTLSLALLLAGCADGDPDDPVSRGESIARDVGCTACHSTDTDDRIGPGWGGMWGSTEELADGRSVTVDEAYVRRSITEPDADVVAGFAPSMPRVPLSESEIDALVAYLREVGR